MRVGLGPRRRGLRNAAPQFDTKKSMARRRFERAFLLHRGFNRFITMCGRAAMTAMIWPRFVAPFRWELTRHAMPLAGLDPVFEGYRILQLTDLHVGRTDVNYLARVFERCLREKPDLIVITGDLIDYDPDSLPILERLLVPLVQAAPRDGVAAIFGNHDYHEYSWRHVGKRSAKRLVHRRLVELLRRVGVRLLLNEQLRVRRVNAVGKEVELIVVGMDEMWTNLADADQAFRGLTVRDPVICLQHNPDGVEFLKPYPWQYMLCGHSHGGQANVPLIGPLYLPMEHREYYRGLYRFPALEGQRLKERVMFVSTGLGYSAPIRMCCKPEATVFTVEGVR
jgi:predicted MPP superfamily phosphohydrolase